MKRFKLYYTTLFIRLVLNGYKDNGDWFPFINVEGVANAFTFKGIAAINDNLRRLCDLQPIFLNRTIGLVRIEDNFLNPTCADLETGTNCSN